MCTFVRKGNESVLPVQDQKADQKKVLPGTVPHVASPGIKMPQPSDCFDDGDGTGGGRRGW